MMDELGLRLGKVESSCSSAHKRIDELSTQITAINDLGISIATMATEMTSVKKTLDGIDGRLDTLENIPAKRWESIVQTVLGLLVAGAFGYFLAK